MSGRNLDSKPDDRTIWVSSGVSAGTGAGFVTVAFGKASGQLDAQAAREFALSVIEAADAAEHDAALMRILTGEFELKRTLAGRVLVMMREQRHGSRIVSARASVETEEPEEPEQ